MQPIQISPSVRSKLKSKHHVAEDEIFQCFARRQGIYLIDVRAEHATEPPTLWFIGKTKHGRQLKIVFMVKAGMIHIKSAYDADKKIVDLYKARNAEFLLLGGSHE